MTISHIGGLHEIRDPAKTFDFKSRSLEPERLDTANFQGPELTQALVDIATFNRKLGGYRSLLRTVSRAVRRLATDSHPLTIVDVGCGSGDGLRALAHWGKAKGIALELVGVDANPAVLEIARSQSVAEPNIEYVLGNAFGPILGKLRPDIIVANQFLHHFTTDELKAYIPELLRHTRALAISDLHRHVVAHVGFGWLARVLQAGAIARHDGLVSIRRGFTSRELEALIEPLHLSHRTIDWCFPFRFEVVLVT